MPNNLTLADIDKRVHSKVYTQSYEKKPTIDGVNLVPLKNFVGEDGDLTEVIKFTKVGEVEHFPGFTLAQINRTTIYPHTVKGWHLHLRQNDIWHVTPSSHLLVGLWDVREQSKTKGAVMRLALGGGSAHLLFIPKGVAHGAANVVGKNAEILYFVDQQFDKTNPDEVRIPWDSLGTDFWQSKRD